MDCLTLVDGTEGCPETSITNYHLRCVNSQKSENLSFIAEEALNLAKEKQATKEVWNKEADKFEQTSAQGNLIVRKICYSSGCTPRKADIHCLLLASCPHYQNFPASVICPPDISFVSHSACWTQYDFYTPTVASMSLAKNCLVLSTAVCKLRPDSLRVFSC